MSLPVTGMQLDGSKGAHLVLVASYPRSGNTWMRLLFESLLKERWDAAAINQLGDGLYGFSRRRQFDRFAPVNAADLLPEEIDVMLPDVFRRFDSERSETTFIKVHDGARLTRNGDWLYPPQSVKAVLYLVRHPFDVAVSYAAHLNLSLPRAVESMGDDREIVSPPGPRLLLPLHQQMGSWSSNAASWTQNNPYSAHVVRYEDLHADPVTVFGKAAKAAGFDVSREDIARAVEATRFDRLQGQEKQTGFRERPATSKAFFRAGRAGTWQGVLDQGLRDKLLRDHGGVMKKFGYRPDGGTDPLP